MLKYSTPRPEVGRTCLTIDRIHSCKDRDLNGLIPTHVSCPRNLCWERTNAKTVIREENVLGAGASARVTAAWRTSWQLVVRVTGEGQHPPHTHTPGFTTSHCGESPGLEEAWPNEQRSRLSLGFEEEPARGRKSDGKSEALQVKEREGSSQRKHVQCGGRPGWAKRRERRLSR